MRSAKPGILFEKKKHPLNVAVVMAKNQFARADHTQGYRPGEVYFNPTDRPAETSIAGLTVLVDQDVRPGFLRVTATEEFTL